MIVIAWSTIAFAARQTPSQAPKFRVAVDVVSIDAVVTDRRGVVVRDLTATDFEVLQDGKVGEGVFALSGLVLHADESVAASEPIDSDRFSLRPGDAIGVYPPRTQLKYAREIYNASSPVQLTLSVWRGTERVLTNPTETVAPPPGSRSPFRRGVCSLSETRCPPVATC